jgi:hypothetical protein
MREKIIAKLKSAVGQTSATTDITLNKWADYLSARITEESQIDAEVELIKPMLETYEGNLNNIVAREVKKAKDTTSQQNQQANEQSQQNHSADDIKALFAEWAEKQNAKNVELETKLTEIEKQKAREKMVSEAKTIIHSKYKISASEAALSEKSLDLALRVGNFEKADDLVTGWKTQFEDLRSTLGLSGVEPVGANSGGGGNGEKPILNSLKKQLEREGKIPKPQVQTT